MKGYIFLDWFFLIFHTGFTLFNLLGWIYKKTRKVNLITLLLTAASWFILGIFFGIGYCPLTDWHFAILEKLGNNELPLSYIKYIIDRIFNINIDPQLTEIITTIGFFLAFTMSAVLNYRDYKFDDKNH